MLITTEKSHINGVAEEIGLQTCQNLPHGFGFPETVNNIFLQELNIPALEHIPHGFFIEETFGACFHLVKIRLDLQAGACSVVDIVCGVETGKEDAIRFEAAFEFGSNLHGDGPGEVMEGQAGEDGVNAVVSKWERLAVVQLKDVSVGNGLLSSEQVFDRKIRGDEVASCVQQFVRVPTPSASQFEDESIC